MPLGVLGFSGPKLKAARRQAGLSRAELADLSCRGAWTVGKYESGCRRPSPNAVRALARVLGCRPIDLLSCEDVAPDAP
jgi:transcriptional regulator with XRE-family HTH domain